PLEGRLRDLARKLDVLPAVVGVIAAELPDAVCNWRDGHGNRNVATYLLRLLRDARVLNKLTSEGLHALKRSLTEEWWTQDDVELAASLVGEWPEEVPSDELDRWQTAT